MLNKKVGFSVVFLALIVVFAGCFRNSANDRAENGDSEEGIENEVIDEIPVICIYNKLTLWSEPRNLKSERSLEVINISEELTWTGREEPGKRYDGSPASFFEVRTSLDKTGWVRSNLVVEKAKPAVIIQDNTILYSKDNELSETESELSAMDFIVVTKEKGDWLNIYESVKYYKSRDFWVKKKDVSFSTDDIQTSILWKRKTAIKNEEKRIKELKKLLEKDMVQASFFKDRLQEEFDNMENPESSEEEGEIQPSDEEPSDIDIE